MKERIIFAPGANGSELLKSLALHGINCFNWRICGSATLAELALMRSGKTIGGKLISSSEEVPLIAEAVDGVEYFTSPSYSDIRNISAAVKRMRSFVPEDEENRIPQILGEGLFKEKNDALVAVYRKYMAILNREGLVDSVSLTRQAIAECKPIDVDFITLKEYPLNPLETALLEKVSEGYEQTSLLGLFGLAVSGDGEPEIKLNSIKNCYGAPKEVESILDDIYSGKKLDQCTVAVTDPTTYAQLFFDFAVQYDIPVTFGCGIPVVNSNPAKLLRLYKHWMTAGFFGIDALKALITSEAFDTEALAERISQKCDNLPQGIFKTAITGLRLTNSGEKNAELLAAFENAVIKEAVLFNDNEKHRNEAILKKNCIPALKALSEELSLPLEQFVFRYSRIRSGGGTDTQRLIRNLDLAAREKLRTELGLMRRSGMNAADIIDAAHKLSVLNGRSESGKLYVTDVQGALSSVRKTLYVAGLSALKYPGSPVENYLLLDADLNLFGEGARQFGSGERIAQKRETLLSLAQLATALNAEINLSYAGLNVSELKKENPSSLVHELSAADKSGESKIVKVGYSEPGISASRRVIDEYINGRTVSFNPVERTENDGTPCSLNERGYSPSSLDVFFACPKRFMLKNVLGIREPDEDDPGKVISAAETGTLAHALMENVDKFESLEDFLARCGAAFDLFVEENPPLIGFETEREKRDFMTMMENAYCMDPRRKGVLKEEDVSYGHESGVTLHGLPDRVEELEEGGPVIVVDYKTGRNVKHETDDIDTCLQAVIYAYILEKNGYEVAGAQYRYPRTKDMVDCKYDEDMRDRLAEKMQAFRSCMDTGVFPLYNETDWYNDEDKDSACKYCKFGGICGKGEN